jgi:Holliday junction DNA helicase RuvA
MIAYLSGKLLAKHATGVIVDVNGVGYEVSIPLSTFYDLAEPGGAVQLSIYTQVREDAIQLFGFKTPRERELFLVLLTVNGVGPKLALAMLSGLSPDELIGAIRAGDVAKLVRLPGVGRKTAERIILELRDKIASLSSPEIEAAATASTQPATPADAVREDVLSALVNLGYQRAAAEKAFKQAQGEDGPATVQALIRRSLQLLAKG